ncbi:hypothetical protein BN8_00927 [Fibrisoma limi BUZ 3]|uniref:UDP-N-acetyl glucosamine 2-epimerase n=1 Tax=Fibrisoma limi BUZ 3 TaxID=1185876 RepID=I2GDJ3_9BACT|nr:hypothetical protein [Fibrisoma limi]CCH51967.1 hypothetical protein BN8_00927 [Fibrisoma limi BUZ 3]
MRKRILLTVGSFNQTSQMVQIAKALGDQYDCWFSQYYADSPIINWAIRQGWLDHTIMGGRFRTASEAYLLDNGKQLDYQGRKHPYDLVIHCSDLIVPANVRATRSVWVQEGMVDPVTPLTHIIKSLKLPRYLSVGTSLNGSSNLCDVYCAASEGYKAFFTKMGTDPGKIFVTGMPNFDDLDKFRRNDFPHRDYVMVATSDIRETFRTEDRPAFIRKAVEMAAGRPLLFKLHPNEDRERAEAEIRENAPEGTLVFQEGNTNEMIANCQELITQYSTVVYVGMALGKTVSSYFDLDELRRLTPIQNGGTSATNIATICRDFLEFTGPRKEFVKSYRFEPVLSQATNLS